MNNQRPLVAILGCGPSGLLAAHACEMRGIPFTILSPAKKSRLGGAQYSHIPIPGIHDPETPTVLKYIIDGDAETYQKKVYGDQQVEFVSFDNVKDGMEVPAWNLSYMYDKLWELYSERIVNYEVRPARIGVLLGAFDLVISSAPADKICLGATAWPSAIHHVFRSQTIRIYNEALDDSLPNNTIWYDGTLDHSFYRMSRIFGVGATEWSAHSPVPPGHELVTVHKPVWTNCDCYTSTDTDGAGVPRGVIRVGRFGAWRKGELSYHSYNAIIEVLAKWGYE